MTEEDFLKAKPKKEDIIDFAEINIQILETMILPKQKLKLWGY